MVATSRRIKRAVAVREGLQSGMRGGAVELIVEGAALVQHAIEDVSPDPTRGEAGNLGGRGELRWLHALQTSMWGKLFRH